MRTGRPKVTLISDRRGTAAIEIVGPSLAIGTARGTTSAHHLGVRRGHRQQGRGATAACDAGDGLQVAGRFVRQRLDGLYDEPRPGAKRTITDEQVEQVIIRTLETTPRGATHWSTRDMANAVGLSHMAISRIWHAFGLQPHRSETFKLSNDPLLVEKVRDIVGLYLDPPAHAAVFCVDEKPQIQALDRTQPLLPMQPGQVERRTHDYKRHGTTTLFAALNAKTSEVITQFHQRHRSAQFREFLT